MLSFEYHCTLKSVFLAMTINMLHHKCNSVWYFRRAGTNSHIEGLDNIAVLKTRLDNVEAW